MNKEIIEQTFVDKNSIDFSASDTINNTTPVTSSVNKFYYLQLDDSEKLIYNSLENNINNLKTDNYIINFNKQFNSLLKQPNGQSTLNSAFQSALDAFFYDHPELFYIDLTKISLSIKSTTIGNNTTYYVSIVPTNGKNYLSDYFSSINQVNTAITSVENSLSTIISTIPSNISDYKKISKIHDSLVNSLEYNSSSLNAHNIYGSFVEHKVVCEGYAKAFKYILDNLNIECILVSGNATNSEGQTEAHMWNYIKLDNNWYGVDVTWDDPVIVGDITKNNLRHTYFVKGSNVFSKSHIITSKISDTGKIFSFPTLNTKNYK